MAEPLTKEEREAICDLRPLHSTLDRYEATVQALEWQLEDYKGYVASVMGEECPSEDTMLVHCTCVPTLRAEVKRLRELVGGDR